MYWKDTAVLAIVISGSTLASMAQSNAADPVTGFVFTESNQADNSVLEFDRTADGALTLAATVPTGGAGGGVVSVGSQGAVAVSQNQQYIFAANEGAIPFRC